jgi:tRNA A37 N6-isopentenylltransferase MiaA
MVEDIKKKAEVILLEMEAVLQKLVENAERLKEISQQVISKQELEPLQKKQEEIVANLKKLDDDFKKVHPHPTENLHPEIMRRIEQKLREFQQLNAKFIENLTASKGVIQFDQTPEEKKKKTK